MRTAAAAVALRNTVHHLHAALLSRCSVHAASRRRGQYGGSHDPALAEQVLTAGAAAPNLAPRMCQQLTQGHSGRTQRELQTGGGTFGSQNPKIQNPDPGRRIDAQERAREHHGARRQPPCTALRSPLGSEPVPYIVLELAPRSNQ